ncbi:MAG: CBS domain-containing protein [Burkholderiaceae bacterium]|nr:CBS domain-containing protein [Burkholderiaceae bacterium]
MAIGFYCNREVVITEPDTTVLDAAQMMRTHHVGTLVIVDKSTGVAKPKGIITDRDLVISVMAQNLKADTIQVADIMSESLYTVHEDENMTDAMRLMRSHGVRRILVVDREGALQGIMSVDDMVTLLADEMQEMANLIAHGQKRERAERR